jgi:predicted enzyme related to lactoylglutathione lyase
MTGQVGNFVWYELMTEDAKAAADFYSKVVGWEAKDSGMPGMDYTIVSAGPAMIGGIMKLPDEARSMGARPGWIGYIGVDDVDAYAKRVVAAGGMVFRPPADIPSVGRFAVVADPHGAAFILFKGAREAPAQDNALGSPGHVGWHELLAGDLAGAFAFYAGLFPWTKAEAIDMGPMGVYQIFAANGRQIGGMMAKRPEMPMAAWVYYFDVDAIDAAVGRVTAAGGAVVNGPQEVPGGWIVRGKDPQGAIFALYAPKR